MPCLSSSALLPFHINIEEKHFYLSDSVIKKGTNRCSMTSLFYFRQNCSKGLFALFYICQRIKEQWIYKQLNVLFQCSGAKNENFYQYIANQSIKRFIVPDAIK